LLVAALASTPAQGAAAMALFAAASSPALWLGPALMQRFNMLSGSQGVLTVAWPVRAAGALIALGSASALLHGLWTRIVAWCT
jgi:uncharacterized protein